MARNNRKKSTKDTRKSSRRRTSRTIGASTRYQPLLGTRDFSTDPVREAVVNQLRKNKAAKNKLPSVLKGGNGSDNAIGSKPEGLQLALDFFTTNPNESAITDFAKKFPSIAKDENIQEVVLSRMTDPAQVGAFARGIGAVVKGFGIESKVVQSKISQIIKGDEYIPTEPTPEQLGRQVSPSKTTSKNAKANSNNVYQNVYVPPEGVSSPSISSDNKNNAARYRPVIEPSYKGIDQQQARNGYAPVTTPQEQQALSGSAPTVALPAFAPVGGNIGTGLPPVLADVGGNAANTLNDSALAIQDPNQGLQFNGLGITNPAIPNSSTLQASSVPAATPAKDNGFHLTRQSMFGDDKNIGWLTGGAKVASGIMGIYNGYKATKLAREQYELKRNAYKLDYTNQAKLLNRDILRTEKNFAAIQNRKHTSSNEDYYKTINKQADRQYQKNKLDVNAANNL